MAIVNHEINSNYSPGLSVQKSLPTPQESKKIIPISSRSWGNGLHLAEFSHNHVDQSAKCNNIISLALYPGRYTEELTFCRGCQKPVISNLTELCDELKLDSLRASLIDSTPEHKADLEQKKDEYYEFVERQKEAAERMRQSYSDKKWWSD